MRMEKWPLLLFSLWFISCGRTQGKPSIFEIAGVIHAADNQSITKAQ